MNNFKNLTNQEGTTIIVNMNNVLSFKAFYEVGTEITFVNNSKLIVIEKPFDILS